MSEAAGIDSVFWSERCQSPIPYNAYRRGLTLSITSARHSRNPPPKIDGNELDALNFVKHLAQRRRVDINCVIVPAPPPSSILTARPRPTRLGDRSLALPAMCGC